MKKSDHKHSRRSRHSSRVMTTSRELSPFAHVSSAVNHVSSSSTKVQGRVQSRTTITSEEESVDRGSKKWGSKAVKADAEDGTVYTESLASVSATWSSSMARPTTQKRHTFIRLIPHVSKVIPNRKVRFLIILPFIRQRFLQEC